MLSNDPLPSATIANWDSEKKGVFAWSPSRTLLASLRNYQNWKSRGRSGRLPCKIALTRRRFSSILTGCDLSINSEIGGGLLIPHRNGNVIFPACQIRPKCHIFQYFTSGSNKSNTRSGVPTLGGRVDLGEDAKIVGSIFVGNNAVTGANAVVLTDVPANIVAMVISLRVISSTDREVS